MLSKGVDLFGASPKDTVMNERSTDAFKSCENKIIRNIEVEFIGFEWSIYDSSKHVNRLASKAGNALHSNTKEKTIRNNLFVKKNTRLNPYLLADNERFLRDVDFILDARLVVIPIPGSDSVDVAVITRDVFSLGAKFKGSADAPQVSIYDLNLAGQGQRLEFSGLFDATRNPEFGYSAFYRKRSLFGTFTNVAVGYTQLNSGRTFGEENEYAYTLNIFRPLVSAYARMAGGLEVSNNWSVNVYNEPDSTFLDYNYKIFDAWVGYNFGIKKSFPDRRRYFLALRYLDGTFVDTPDQEKYEDVRDYNSMKGVLGEFTFYRKNYFKTRYVYGFGRTEDVLYGVSAAITAGYLRELAIDRPYAAFKYNSGRASKKGNFYVFNFQVGGYLKGEEFQDVLLNSTVSYYTRALNLNRYKLRGAISGGYSQLFNRTTDDYLTIRKSEVRGFSADTLKGTQRFSAHVSATLFSPWSLLGFRFAPFAGLDWAAMECINCTESTINVFGLNAGIKTRNENLTFGTMELRFIYIPDDGTGSNEFKIEFKQNLQVKNSGTFADKPKPVYD